MFNSIYLISYSPTLFKGIVEYDNKYYVVDKEGNQTELRYNIGINRILYDVAVYADYKIVDIEFGSFTHVKYFLYLKYLRSKQNEEG